MRFSLTQAFIAIEWTSSGSFICSMMGKPWVIGWILKPKEIFLRCFGQWQIFSQILKRLCTTVIQSAQNGCLIAHWAVLKSKLGLAKFADQPMKSSRKPLFCKVHWHANSVVDIFTWGSLLYYLKLKLAFKFLFRCIVLRKHVLFISEDSFTLRSRWIYHGSRTLLQCS